MRNDEKMRKSITQRTAVGSGKEERAIDSHIENDNQRTQLKKERTLLLFLLLLLCWEYHTEEDIKNLFQPTRTTILGIKP
jgi:hypothetical protein